MTRWIVLATVLAAAVAPGLASAASPTCGSYPRPGTLVHARAPSGLLAQYGVLRRAPRPADRIALRRLGPLPESQILTGSVRYLGAVAEGGRVYLVAARHLLPESLEPPRCLPAAQRSLQRALLPSLRRDYARRALCLVIVYALRAAPTCEPAPGTVVPLLIASGAPGLGIAPDGVARVRLHFRTRPAATVPVHANFWRLIGPDTTPVPCGLDWLDRAAVVLRTVVSCSTNRDSS